MPHDQAYLQAEKKIEEALKSGATKPTIQHPSIRSLFVDAKGGNHGA